MKNYISGLFLLLMLTACNTKNEGDEKSDNGSAEKFNVGYFMGIVGTNDNGTYTVTTSDVAQIEEKWEASIKKKLGLSDDVELKGFEIIKSKTKGDVVEDCYMLMSKTTDGSTTIAAILELKEDKFYFETRKMGDLTGYLTVICRGICEKGCIPVVKLQNGLKSLNCSACADCEKTDSEMY